MSLSPSLSASLAASITRMADKRITGQEYLDEDEDEREDEGEGEDEAEHSDDGDLDELEDSDKDGSDEVDGSEDDHVFIGVFNPRHSRGESTFQLRTERRADGMGYNIVPITNTH
ncbi:hypothetical protein KCU91_g3400, partial [Aureobasidium melanogenum]